MKKILILLLCLCLTACSVPNNISNVSNFDDDLLAYMDAMRENYVVSPLSLKIVLALVTKGASGTTQKELLHALNFSSEKEMDDWYKSILDDEERHTAKLLSASYFKGAYNISNSIWSQNKILDSYVSTIKDYNAIAKTVSADKITQEVNDWCNDVTNGLIPKLANDLSDKKHILLNAIYLKAKWEKSFDNTESHMFTDIDGKTTMKDMLIAQKDYRFYEDENTKLVVFRLNGGFDFVAVLGDATNWRTYYNQTKDCKVDVWIPKLDIEVSLNGDKIIDFLKSRGVTTAFTNDADFSKITGEYFHIDEIMQKARLRTDEEGLEAAAISGIFDVTGILVLEDEYKIFHATEPFKYFIVSTLTKEPLIVFAGQEVK